MEHGQTGGVYVGNSEETGRETRKWIIGSFMPAGPLREQLIGVKVGSYEKGENRPKEKMDAQKTSGR